MGGSIPSIPAGGESAPLSESVIRKQKRKRITIFGVDPKDSDLFDINKAQESINEMTEKMYKVISKESRSGAFSRITVTLTVVCRSPLSRDTIFSVERPSRSSPFISTILSIG